MCISTHDWTKQRWSEFTGRLCGIELSHETKHTTGERNQGLRFADLWHATCSVDTQTVTDKYASRSGGNAHHHEACQRTQPKPHVAGHLASGFRTPLITPGLGSLGGTGESHSWDGSGYGYMLGNVVVLTLADAHMGQQGETSQHITSQQEGNAATASMYALTMHTASEVHASTLASAMCYGC